MTFIDVSGQPGDYSSRIVFPIRSIQAGESRHEIHASIIGNGVRKSLDLCAGSEYAEIVAKPLYQRSGDRNASLQRVSSTLVRKFVRDGRQKTVLGMHRSFTSVHQNEAACSVRVFCFSWLETS